MNRYIKQHGVYSNHYQQVARAELSREIEAYLNNGGKIEELKGPEFQPHKVVRASNALLSEVL